MVAWFASSVFAATKEGTPLRDALLREAAQPSKPAWQPMLRYLAELHGLSVFPALAHFQHPFESIGPGYQGGMVFGSGLFFLGRRHCCGAQQS